VGGILVPERNLDRVEVLAGDSRRLLGPIQLETVLRFHEKMKLMEVEFVVLGRAVLVTPYARNARTHSAEQVDQIAASIREWGWTIPVLVDESGGLIAGHARLLAARKLGLVDVPVMVASGWSEAQKCAYVLADNELAMKAGPGDVAYVWHAAMRVGESKESLEEAGFALRAQIIWAKNNFAISRGHYHFQHEPCWYAVREGSTGHWCGGHKQTSVWHIDKPQKSETGHSTQKPVECMKRPIENNSSPGQAVYDPFVGSFTTGIACEMTGRACHAIELSPAYIDVQSPSTEY
jgi:hypothetical protein